MTPLTPAEQQLVETHHNLLCRVARKRSPDWWRDARQIGFIGLVKGIRSFCPDGGMPLEKWLARHIDFEIRRAIDRGKAPLATPELVFDVAAEGDGFEAFERQDEIDAMRAAVDDLPDPYRQVILFYLETNNKEAAARRLKWGQLRYNQALLVAQEYLRWRCRGGARSAAA